MRIPAALIALTAMLPACSALSGSKVPDEITGLCIGTVQAEGVRLPLNMRLHEIVEQLELTGFEVWWSGGADGGTLNARKTDQFADKTTNIAFETERDAGLSTAMCKDGMVVLARAKVNGELLHWYASQDLVYTLAEQYRRTHPYQPTAEEQARRREAERRQREQDHAAAEARRKANTDAEAARAERERLAAEQHAQREREEIARQTAFDECDRQRNAAQATKPLEDGYATYRSFECELKRDRKREEDNAKYQE